MVWAALSVWAATIGVSGLYLHYSSLLAKRLRLSNPTLLASRLRFGPIPNVILSPTKVSEEEALKLVLPLRILAISDIIGIVASIVMIGLL